MVASFAATTRSSGAAPTCTACSCMREMSSPNSWAVCQTPDARSCVTCSLSTLQVGQKRSREAMEADELDLAPKKKIRLGPARHAVDHRLQRAQAHEAAVRCAPYALESFCSAAHASKGVSIAMLHCKMLRRARITQLCLYDDIWHAASGNVHQQ